MKDLSKLMSDIDSSEPVKVSQYNKLLYVVLELIRRMYRRAKHQIDKGYDSVLDGGNSVCSFKLYDFEQFTGTSINLLLKNDDNLVIVTKNEAGAGIVQATIKLDYIGGDDKSYWLENEYEILKFQTGVQNKIIDLKLNWLTLDGLCKNVISIALLKCNITILEIKELLHGNV